MNVYKVMFQHNGQAWEGAREAHYAAESFTEALRMAEPVDPWMVMKVELVCKLDGVQTPPETISDDLGNTWSVVCPDCGKPTMQVVRPGKVQCTNCG